jgi:ABC-type oligopeptide transport system substrate-binding subunit
VTVADVRATIERALAPELGYAAPGASALRDVVGVPAYRAGRATTISGIRIRGRDLIVVLRRPAANLARRLALPEFCVLPAGTPAPPGGDDEPLPTAGPYYLAAHQGGVIAVLRRNPGYRGPRPRQLDAVVVHMDIGRRRGRDAVRRGSLDIYEDAVGPRVGCRQRLAGVPGPDLAALCVPASTQLPHGRTPPG